MSESLAAVFGGEAGVVDLVNWPTPEPGTGEILVRVVGCTLCASDRHTFEGRRAVPVPTILGHETVGAIVAFGPGASRLDMAGQPLSEGDLVTWAVVAHCGRCDHCERGLEQKCRHGVKYGHVSIDAASPLRGAGGLSQHDLLVPGSVLARVPEDLPLEVACPASCATATASAALEAAGGVMGRSVAVLGAGLLGLTACAMARTLGARRVVGFEPDAARRDLAARFGADTMAPPDAIASIAAMLEPGPGFDVVVELSGQPEAFELAFPTLRLGGSLVLVGGVFPSRPVGLPMEAMIRGLLTIRGVHNYAPRHLATALSFLESHHEAFPFRDLVAEWFPLERARDAFARAADPRVFRVGVMPGLDARS